MEGGVGAVKRLLIQKSSETITWLISMLIFRVRTAVAQGSVQMNRVSRSVYTKKSGFGVGVYRGSQ